MESRHITAFMHQLPKHFREKYGGSIKQAVKDSAEAHRGQTRWDGSPYIYHPLAVALIILLEFHFLDIYTTLAAIRHDGPEDQKTEKEEAKDHRKIKRKQGSEPAAIVRAVTKPRNQEKRKYWFAVLLMTGDYRAFILKFADRIHNLRTLAHLPKTRRRKKLAETKLYFPILRDALQVAIDLDIKNKQLHASYADLPNLCFNILEKEITRLESLKTF